MRLALVTLLAGCSSILGIEDLSGPGGNPDGGGGSDADPIDGAPGARRVAGKLIALAGPVGDLPRAGVPMSFVPQIAGEDEISAISDADGGYSFDYGDGSNDPMVGFVRTNLDASRFMLNYPRPFADPISFDVLLFEDPEVQQLGALAGTNPNPNAEFFALQVEDGAGNPRSNIALQLDSPLVQVVYARANGDPDTGLSATSESGRAYVFNAPNGAATRVTAIQNGAPINERLLAPTLPQTGTRSFVVVVVP